LLRAILGNSIQLITLILITARTIIIQAKASTMQSTNNGALRLC
jgi:hypothetical protein